MPGGAGVRFLRSGKPLLDEPGLSALTIEDPWGTWGDFAESIPSQSLTQVRDIWRVTKVEVGERGPLRATLNVRMEAGRSRMDLTLALWKGRNAVDISTRVFWDERCARLKLALPGGFSQAEYDVMGGTVRRGSVGEVPGGRWVKLDRAGDSLGFASDALYNFNLTPEGVLQATIVRATRYAADLPAKGEEHPWRPVLDVGELRFRFLLTSDTTVLERLSAELEQPPLAMHVIPSPGPGAKTGGFMKLSPESVRVLAIKPAEDRKGWILRLQSFAGAPVVPEIQWMGQALTLGHLQPRALATYRFQREPGGKWQPTPVDLFEN